MPRFAVVFAIALLSLAPGQARAWNSIGHLAVSKLAYDDLDSAERLRLFKLLEQHPHYKAFLAAGRPDDVDAVQWAILRCSVWPDWIRPRGKDPRGPDVTRFHRGEEHYVNIPLIDPQDEEFYARKTLISPDLTNIVCALKQRCNDLKTRTAAAEDRAVAACWVFHLVGDIHQPLHNVSYFSRRKGFEDGDLGGNKFGIRADGRKWKLHAFWDDLLGEDRDYRDDSAGHQAGLYKAAVAVAERLRGVKFMDEDRKQLAGNTTFESWSREGFELARTVAYAKADGSGLLAGALVPFNGAVPDGAPEVGEEYIRRARATAERRAVLAGRRLAERVKVLLK